MALTLPARGRRPLRRAKAQERSHQPASGQTLCHELSGGLPTASVTAGLRHFNDLSASIDSPPPAPMLMSDHPQYDGFILIMLGFLLQWPTLLTLLMFPILVVM